MLKQERVPSVPLITCDPYFSLWSPADALNGADTCHWTGNIKKVSGVLTVDGAPFRFMGLGDSPAMEQTGLEIRATSSRYTFSGGGVELRVTFLTPLLLTDLDLMSRPVSYIDMSVKSIDGQSHNAQICVEFSKDFCRDTAGDNGDGEAVDDGNSNRPGEQGDGYITGEINKMNYGSHKLPYFEAVWIGKKKQAPLSHSGDNVTIDWGYLYLAVPDAHKVYSAVGAHVTHSFLKAGEDGLAAVYEVRTTEGGELCDAHLIVAYDDIASINYFGSTRKGYWARCGKTILEAIGDAVSDYETIKTRCEIFDDDLDRRSCEVAGEGYSLITRTAYRQVIAAHKLVTDENGDAVFISKECFSNGCAATADVSYPSTPLFLLYAPELINAMLRPVLRFASSPVWTFDFAPHDAGRYPYVTGQVYGLRRREINGVPARRAVNGEVYPPFWEFPSNSDIYEHRYQMPVEECGNMLLMAAAAAAAVKCADFAKPHMKVFERWAAYLLNFGEDPGEQLCTDDFAGHLAHNCNLAAKAVNGIEAYSILLKLLGRAAESEQYHNKAVAMAASWTARAAVNAGQEAGVTEPVTGATKIEVGAEKPVADASKIEVGATKPEAGAAKPVTVAAKIEMSAAKLVAVAGKLVAVASKPEAGAKNTASTALKPSEAAKNHHYTALVFKSGEGSSSRSGEDITAATAPGSETGAAGVVGAPEQTVAATAPGWSLKYNLIWDRLFGSGLFDGALYANEVQKYLIEQNKYGVPLDNRATYTKSDWILWVASFCDSVEDRARFIAPVARFLRETEDRVPFSDLYDTVSAKHRHFQNRTVQGGLFMPLLAESGRLRIYGK